MKLIAKIRLEKKLNKIVEAQEKFNSFYKDQKDINKDWFVSNFILSLKIKIFL